MGGARADKAELPLSAFALKAIALIRKTPPSRTAFSLTLTAEGTRKRISVIDRGKGPDSSFHVHLSKSREVPAWLPPTSTYAVATQEELDSVLAMFADHPELYSREPGDALDSPGAVAFDESDEDMGEYEGV